MGFITVKLFGLVLGIFHLEPLPDGGLFQMISSAIFCPVQADIFLPL